MRNKNKNSNLDELLPLVYDDVPEMLHPIARDESLSSFNKLQDEEKIKSVENRYSSFYDLLEFFCVHYQTICFQHNHSD